MTSGMDFQLYLVRMMALAPVWLVLFVGVILAIQRIPQAPRSSWTIIAAIGLNIINIAGLSVVMNLAMTPFRSFNSSHELWLRMLIYTLPQAVVSAISWGLILFAVFDRPVPPRFLEEDERSARGGY